MERKRKEKEMENVEKEKEKQQETETFAGETVKNSTNKNQALKCEKIAKSIIK